ncbi:hypothetical protein BP6252_00974 [Coleophoma cylindrospora]|uniref:ADP-ribosylation factor n=1 Tax=Coleophoma cylindrospora TaxID=1849047 RepID=A0A3D8SRM0_9HELO|nr:hypothetical protein BP6252_00974 [Coleophoma cylindrospora]
MAPDYHRFRNFDDQAVFDDSQDRAEKETTRNFVVEFGKDDVQVAFDLNSDRFTDLLKTGKSPERPVRWINIWAPNQQTDTMKVLGSHYKFSPRLQAIIRTVPEPSHPVKDPKVEHRFRAKAFAKNDPEVAAKSIDSPTAGIPTRIRSVNTSHYEIARQMVSYQSVDVGAHFLCIGANWMHQAPKPKSKDDESIVAPDAHRRLWSWLVLCDDRDTVISLHEDPGEVEDITETPRLRDNVLSVFRQLSQHGHKDADPVSMQSVRQALPESPSDSAGVEGASNLFYYLFDDWRAVYASLSRFHKRLEALQTSILGNINKKPNSTPDMSIIPSLHMLGRDIRVRQHLYQGYSNLIQRIVGPRDKSVPRPVTYSAMQGQNGVVVASSAQQRFERLGDRLELLILSEMREFLVEKDALISTYFNLNAQKDSEATARLTRSATLLAKLSVLFLPVSLMTSYFSVQINDLAGVYTARDYWSAFAVIMSISFISIFLLSKSLMWITETLEAWVKSTTKYCKRAVIGRRPEIDVEEEVE